MTNLLNCPKCEAPLKIIKIKKLSTIDIAGAMIVVTIIFGFLSFFVFSGKIFRLVVLLGGLVAFGLFQMVGYSTKKQLKCTQCGFEHNY